ncbi:unnamed protein product, partial [Mesorhabditis spiculigera]
MGGAQYARGKKERSRFPPTTVRLHVRIVLKYLVGCRSEPESRRAARHHIVVQDDPATGANLRSGCRWDSVRNRRLPMIDGSSTDS